MMMSREALVILAGAGVGLYTAAVTWLAMQTAMRGARDRVASRARWPPRPAWRRRGYPAAGKAAWPALAGAVLAASVAWGTGYLPLAVLTGALAGQGGLALLLRLRRSRREFIKLKELAVLYEGVDLFARAGFTVRQALQMSAILVPTLRPAVERCLDRWPGGPLRALRQLGEDIGIPEADLLVGILMHAEEAGVRQIAGIMEEEAARLEGLRRAMAETRVSVKPIYATLYNFLPLTAALGMLLAPLTYRAVTMLSSLRIQP